MGSVHLVRHGEADWQAMNARRLPDGINDLVALTAQGLGEAPRAAAQLSNVGDQAQR
ncbi:histidine phosphatase family protein [uncultured Jatrophihabitans sp.]|uniref:histidine phosphatase family protein n=1 Tax=uncultured Jatrophihabitans sp. TaxID=1610747 RepID=UPI0035CC9D47